MKAALICPVPELKRYGHGSFHLLLSHLLSKPDYRSHYKKQRDAGAYLVLDNSAHEQGAGSDPEELLMRAMDIRAQEIVVPDVLFSYDGTVVLAETAIERWASDKTNTFFTLNPRLMYVPQGRVPYEWARCLGELIKIHRQSIKYGFRKDLVVGLSKDYEMWGEDGLEELIDEYLKPCFDLAQKKHFRFDVHLLGWGRKLWKLEGIARRNKWIRSTDSAKPFVYALSNITLNPDEPEPLYPTRTMNYFSRRLTEEQHIIALKNCSIFKAVATGSRKSAVYL